MLKLKANESGPSTDYAIVGGVLVYLITQDSPRRPNSFC